MPFHIAPRTVYRFLFLLILAIIGPPYYNNLNEYVVSEEAQHTGYNLHFAKDVEHLSMCLFPIHIFFGKMATQVFYSFLNWVVCLISES